jgi:hypothetical protein
MFQFSQQLLSDTFFAPAFIELRLKVLRIHAGLHVNCSFFSHNFDQIWNVVTEFIKIPEISNLMHNV